MGENLDLDAQNIIMEAFLGYKYRKQNNILFNSEVNVPRTLITMYYGLDTDEKQFDTIKKAFINKYIKNESQLEEVDMSHSREEMAGLGKMYEFIHSDEIEMGGIPPFNFKYRDIYESQKGRFNIWSLQDLHSQLFSLVPFPEEAGKFRNFDVYLPRSGVETCPWYEIENVLTNLDGFVQSLRKSSEKINLMRSYSEPREYINELFAYIENCIILNCRLIRIHPFSDGNGRTIRGFTNKLFEDVGLPPVYVTPKEKEEYGRVMNLAITENDYSGIFDFYNYKICDSIMELDINERIKKERKEREERKGAIKKKNLMIP